MKTNRLHSSKSGFTMVEMLVVATIIGLLAMGGLVSYRTANRNARDAKRKSDLEQVKAALELYRFDNPTYPNTSSWNTMMGQIGSYMSNSSQIQDPRNTSPYVYTYTYAGGGCSGYRICARLESATPADYCSCNP